MNKNLRNLLTKRFCLMQQCFSHFPPEIQSALMFATMVYLSDDYLVISPLSAGSRDDLDNRTRRFFRIALMLPMELQMILANRAAGSNGTNILRKMSEPAFRNLGQRLAQQ